MPGAAAGSGPAAPAQAWTQNYHITSGWQGPTACGKDTAGDIKRATYIRQLRSVSKDRELHRLLSNLQDGRIGSEQIDVVSEGFNFNT